MTFAFFVESLGAFKAQAGFRMRTVFVMTVDEANTCNTACTCLAYCEHVVGSFTSTVQRR